MNVELFSKNPKEIGDGPFHLCKTHQALGGSGVPDGCGWPKWHDIPWGWQYLGLDDGRPLKVCLKFVKFRPKSSSLKMVCHDSWKTLRLGWWNYTTDRNQTECSKQVTIVVNCPCISLSLRLYFLVLWHCGTLKFSCHCWWFRNPANQLRFFWNSVKYWDICHINWWVYRISEPSTVFPLSFLDWSLSPPQIRKGTLPTFGKQTSIRIALGKLRVGEIWVFPKIMVSPKWMVH